MSFFSKLSACTALTVAVSLSSGVIAANTAPAPKAKATPPTVSAPTATPKDNLDQRIHDYLMSNPKVILDAVQKYQQDQQLKARKDKFDAGLTQTDALRTPMYQTVAGNPNGSITMVEFFDYQCIMCYRVYKDIDTLIATNKDLRVVFRLLPIFGEASVYAAKVDIAAALQHKYAKFHDILFKAKRVEGKLKDADVRKAAKQAGVHLTASVMKEVAGKKGLAFLKENKDLAKKLRINGTPAFYIMPTKGTVTKEKLAVFAGAAPRQYLQQAIDRISGKDAAKKAAAATKKAAANAPDSSDSDIAGDDQVDPN